MTLLGLRNEFVTLFASTTILFYFICVYDFVTSVSFGVLIVIIVKFG